REPVDQIDSLRDVLRTLYDPKNAGSPPSQFLRDLVRRYPGPGPALASLIGYETDDRVADAAKMMLFVAAQDAGVPPEAGKAILDSAASTLLRAMRDPSVPDERKFTIGPLLRLTETAIPDDEYR